jgi:hypothetical protein
MRQQYQSGVLRKNKIVEVETQDFASLRFSISMLLPESVVRNKNSFQILLIDVKNTLQFPSDIFFQKIIY